MRFPQAFIDRLKDHFLVSEIVGRQVALRRHGREFLGLCPFHKEKTPSFTVNDEKSFYHCFGCGAHGDAITFIKDTQGLSYPEAIERLAQEAGIAIPKPSAEEAAKDRKILGLQEVIETACQWFEAQLQHTTGYHAKAYLEERGLSAETIRQFRIGYAPDDKDSFKRDMLAQGISEAQMVEAGLIIEAEGRERYSRFRGRVMFPIRDRKSKVIAFGGRILPKLASPHAPKYLNSPETELFKKGQMLYNYDQARKPALDHGMMVVCEGYMDVIALAQVGIDCAVAPLGTAITVQQLQLLWQACDNPVLCLDGDSAGERAMLRASELALPLLQPGKSLKFAKLPDKEDPDSLVRNYGAASMRELLNKAVGLAETIWDSMVPTGGKQTPEQRAGLEQSLMQLVEQIAQPTVKAHYRAFFREQLWKRPSTGMAKVGKVSVSAPSSKALPLLPQAKDQSSRVYRSLVQATQLALLYPQLLRDAVAEEMYSRIEVADSQLSQLQQGILRVVCDYPETTRSILQKGLEDQGLASLAKAMLSQRTIWPKGFKDDEEGAYLQHAKRMWLQTMNAYSLAMILDEFKRAESEMALQLGEQALERFMALKLQKEALERERDDLYNAEMMEGA